MDPPFQRLLIHGSQIPEDLAGRDAPTQIVRAAKDDRQPRLLRNHIMAKPAHHVRRQLSAYAADLHDRPFPETVLEKAAVWGILGERIFARGRTKAGC